VAAKTREEKAIEAAAYKVVLRDTLENDLLIFLRYFYPLIEGVGNEFIISHHHEAIVSNLLAMYRGELPDEKIHLMINMPPRYGKTIIMCYFIAWLFAKHPRQKVMHLSCSDSLVIDNMKLIVKIMKTDEYQALWPSEFISNLEHNFVLKEGGYMYGSSTGGEVIGKGCGSTQDDAWGGLLWIDDPLKPGDALSETLRNKVNTLCGWAIRTRRNNPRATPCVMVMQRLHDSDPAGYVMASESQDKWKLLKMKAVQDDGSALWPFKHSVEELEKERLNDRWMFSSQYQQEPVPEEGDYFKEVDARYYSRLPENLEYYICSDIALSAGKGDFTEHGVFGVDADNNVYIADWWSGQVDDVNVVESLVDLIKRYRPRFSGNEAGPTWKAIEGSLKKRLIEEKCYVPLEVVSAAGDKGTKASTFQGLWRFNKVYLPVKKKWADELLYQMLRFPKGKFDDKVDALSIFGRLIDKVRGGKKTPALTIVKKERMQRTALFTGR
jgi:predicted phage terminase large subunit-like protein